MRIADVMTRLVHTIDPTATIGDAAQNMGLFDVGMLPVIDDAGGLVGVVTDRDVIVRGVAEGLFPGTPIARIMTQDVSVCHEEDDVVQVLRRMGDEQVRRLPVCSKQERLVGIVALADFARRDHCCKEVGEAVRAICRPHGYRSQCVRAA